MNFLPNLILSVLIGGMLASTLISANSIEKRTYEHDDDYDDEYDYDDDNEYYDYDDNTCDWDVYDPRPSRSPPRCGWMYITTCKDPYCNKKIRKTNIEYVNCYASECCDKGICRSLKSKYCPKYYEHYDGYDYDGGNRPKCYHDDDQDGGETDYDYDEKKVEKKPKDKKKKDKKKSGYDYDDD